MLPMRTGGAYPDPDKVYRRGEGGQNSGWACLSGGPRKPALLQGFACHFVHFRSPSSVWCQRPETVQHQRFSSRINSIHMTLIVIKEGSLSWSYGRMWECGSRRIAPRAYQIAAPRDIFISRSHLEADQYYIWYGQVSCRVHNPQ